MEGADSLQEARLSVLLNIFLSRLPFFLLHFSRYVMIKLRQFLSSFSFL